MGGLINGSIGPHVTEEQGLVRYLPLLVSVLVLAVLVKLVYSTFGWNKRRSLKARYVPYENANMANEGILVVDCTHPKLPTLTHHKGHSNPEGLRVRRMGTWDPWVWGLMPPAACLSSRYTAKIGMAALHRAHALQPYQYIRELAPFKQ